MKQSYDLIVVGGGAFGLWTTVEAAAAGLDVLLIEQGRCGGGASATPLGALMPHLPGDMDAVKRLQFDALSSLPAALATVEAETGMAVGYRRRGRLIPLRSEAARKRAIAAHDVSHDAWQTAATGFRFSVDDPSATAIASDWIAPGAAAFGVAADTLTASIDAPSLLDALEALARKCAEVREGVTFGAWDDEAGTARDAAGHRIANSAALVVTAGHASYRLVAAPGTFAAGVGVKGHVALIGTNRDVSDLPVIFDKGMMIVARSADTVAVGGTTEPDVSSPDAEPDSPAVARLLATARAALPALRGGPVRGVWAGIRPRSHSRLPMVGPVPERRGLYVATGGYKITLAIAHVLAQWTIASVAGTDGADMMPPQLRPRSTSDVSGMP